ncbi:hypothetical protein D515_02320 [Grimontia indica]|uniref:Uncharacterized protein n=1 Tax=Grimontia indica TaxID=1056512 RepID=R1GRU0_9GAMM|nr:hypothetical protein D515_02320 [Grimontia indica]
MAALSNFKRLISLQLGDKSNFLVNFCTNSAAYDTKRYTSID